MQRLTTLAAALLWMATMSPNPSAADEAPTTDPNVLAHARTLLAQLADADYTQRQAATEQLAGLGSPVRPVLEAALRSPDVETRMRVRRILSLIDQDEFEVAIADFLTDTEDLREHRLPTWPRFRELAGSGPSARKMFVSMLRAEGQLLAEVQENPRDAARTFQQRLEQLQMNSSNQQREIDAANLGAVLFVASDERVPMVAGNDSLLYRFCSHSSVEQALENNDPQSIMRRIVGAWIASGRGGYYGLRLAMQHALAEGLESADAMLDDKTPSYYRQYAILTYAKLGNKQHISKLEKMLNDATVCTTHRLNDETFQTQFRDIALVAVLHLYGKDPQNFGFERARPHSEYVYAPHTLGFKGEDERSIAFAKWDAFRRTLEK